MIGGRLIGTAIALGLAAVAPAADGVAQRAATASPTASVQIAGPVLMVGDLDRSLRFYTEGLGLVVGTRLQGPPGPGATVTAGAGSPSPFVLLRQQAATPTTDKVIEPGNGLSRVMLLVPDSAVVAARLDAAGYPHTPLTKWHVFFVNDPDGYRYEVMQRDSHH